MSERLSRYFEGFAFKRLSAVETSPQSSNQHEFNGIKAMKELFGDQKTEYTARFLYLDDSPSDAVTNEGLLTWYDARKTHPKRSEWRLYYTDSDVFEAAAAGDLLLIAKISENELLAIVASAGSTGENQIRLLFGLPVDAESRFVVRDLFEKSGPEVGFASRMILSMLEVELEKDDDHFLDDMLAKFGGRFPTTRVFSDYARAQCGDVDSLSDPDSAVLAWLTMEERLFRVLEKHLVWRKIRDGFESVDEYISSSLSVLNRRKSRAGHAAENHLEQVFVQNGVNFVRGATTEGRSKPDFVFPGIDNYLDASFPAENLTMLGVKTTCKDRWRQVLAEAARISDKHLFTLEPAVSENQTEEMVRNRLQLVLPYELHSTYSLGQQPHLLSLSGFMDRVQFLDKRA